MNKPNRASTWGLAAGALVVWVAVLMSGCDWGTRALAAGREAGPREREALAPVISERWGVRIKLPTRDRVVLDDDTSLDVTVNVGGADARSYLLRATRADVGAAPGAAPLDAGLLDALAALGRVDALPCGPAQDAVWSAHPGRAMECYRAGQDEVVVARAVRVGARLIVAAARGRRQEAARFLESATIFDDLRTSQSRDSRRAARAALSRGDYPTFCARMADEGFDPELCASVARMAQGQKGPRAARELTAAVGRVYGVHRKHGAWTQEPARGVSLRGARERRWPLMDALETLFASRGAEATARAQALLDDVGEHWWERYCVADADGHCALQAEAARN